MTHELFRIDHTGNIILRDGLTLTEASKLFYQSMSEMFSESVQKAKQEGKIEAYSNIVEWIESRRIKLDPGWYIKPDKIIEKCKQLMEEPT